MGRVLDRIADLWCQFMHEEIMWPSHGRYKCLTCGRQYRACWEEASPAAPRALVSPRGIGVPRVLAPAVCRQLAARLLGIH